MTSSDSYLLWGEGLTKSTEEMEEIVVKTLIVYSFDLYPLLPPSLSTLWSCFYHILCLATLDDKAKHRGSLSLT